MAKWITATVTLTGATGTAYSPTPPPGAAVVSVFRIEYVGQAATCDVVITEEMPNGSERPLLTVANNATNGDYPVAPATVSIANVATGMVTPLCIGGRYKVAVAGGAEGSVSVHALML